MIYLDNAATSFPKPTEAAAAMHAAVRSCAGYGRSVHPAALRAAEIVYDCRAELAELFHAPAPEYVAFTMNATMALNYAIHALVPRRAAVCISGYEHNSVVRPLKERRCALDVVAPRDGEKLLEAWETAIRKKPACVIVNHASNVFGYLQPLKEIGALCAQYGVPLIVDASQTAGVCEIDLSKLPTCAAVCTAGHKGLLGPQGTGVLVCTDRLPRRALITGGTGSRSVELRQPRDLPDVFESGTHNLPGIAGLLEAVRLVRRTGTAHIRLLECELCARFEEQLAAIPGLRIAGHPPVGEKLAVVSVVPEGAPCELLAERLAEQGVCVRAGLHCAPMAHRSEGTLETGTVRFSIGWKNTPVEIDSAVRILASIMNTF